MKTKGITIGGYGMPGCGKTSVTKTIGKLLGASTFQEPEEEFWPWTSPEETAKVLITKMKINY